MTPQRLVNLEVNDSGAWRRVTSFALNDFEDGDLELRASHLLSLSSNPKLKARLIIPGDIAPLLSWTRDTGWTPWRAPTEPLR
jgi:hypothetical protein